MTIDKKKAVEMGIMLKSIANNDDVPMYVRRQAAHVLDCHLDDDGLWYPLEFRKERINGS